MPTYTFRNRKTGKVVEQFMHIADLDVFSDKHPELEQIFSTSPFSIGDSVRMGIRKPDQSFRELLKHIHNKTGGNHHYHHN